MNPPKIDIKDLLKDIDSFYIVDVRSEKEFLSDHILNSINMPILDNDQRHIIGYIYKQIDPEKAISLGYDILNDKIEEYIKKLSNISKKIVILCSRGGMRSGSITHYLIKRNVNAIQLDRGYKAYRNQINEKINDFDFKDKQVFILQGLTGSNKTKIIQGIKYSLDLEGFAKHRSSLFGAVGLIPNTQKFFETLLLNALEKSSSKILFEGESKKIGDLFIPDNIFAKMSDCININIEMSLKQRINNIIVDYFDSEEKVEEVKNIIPKLKEKLGKKKINEMLLMIDEKKYFDVVKILLADYYDPLYSHTVDDDRDYALVVKTDDTDEAIKRIDEFIENY